jgi:acetylglutamate kinase
MAKFSTPPDENDIYEAADAALAAFPAELAAHIKNLAITIEDVADEETLAEMGLEHPWDLTGLYQGVPLPLRDRDHAGHFPDRIYLYREPILIEWIDSGEDFQKLVASVLIHEIGHHVGLSDADITRIEASVGF